MADIAWPAKDKRNLIGKRIDRVDGPVKVTGAAKYSYDINRPGHESVGRLRVARSCEVQPAEVYERVDERGVFLPLLRLDLRDLGLQLRGRVRRFRRLLRGQGG